MTSETKVSNSNNSNSNQPKTASKLVQTFEQIRQLGCFFESITWVCCEQQMAKWIQQHSPAEQELVNLFPEIPMLFHSDFEFVEPAYAKELSEWLITNNYRGFIAAPKFVSSDTRVGSCCTFVYGHTLEEALSKSIEWATAVRNQDPPHISKPLSNYWLIYHEEEASAAALVSELWVHFLAENEEHAIEQLRNFEPAAQLLFVYRGASQDDAWQAYVDSLAKKDEEE